MLHENIINQPGIRRAALLGLPVVLLSLALAGSSSAEIRRDIRCDITQLVLTDCPNGIRADFDNGRHTWSFAVAGPIAFAEKMETYLLEPEAVYIVDWPTRDAQNMRFVDVEKAWFLYDAEGNEELSQSPHIFGFRKKEAAEEAQEEIGGELKRWDYVFEEVTQIAADWDRTSKHRYGNLREGRR